MAAEAPVPILSVVICTYDRPDLVAQVLETIAQQDAPPDAYEVLVIDNASPGDIAGVVAPFEQRIPRLRCIREEAVGLSHARNRGRREARGEYVAYVDDDCKLPPEWVSTALRVIRDIRPIMFGGPYRAFYMTPKPRWFRDEYGSAAVSDEARPLRVTECVSGGNMVIRKDALEAVGGFDPSLGMTGMTMAYGEETALQNALRERYGPDCVYYDPALWVYHLVRPEKMNVR
ncbi:MAG: glycosyltransferase family 2 protein, partial [Armatimonadetes bacterium]|nr:glycosyltransferase family 2 protein [Armatimonadota bacterium]